MGGLVQAGQSINLPLRLDLPALLPHPVPARVRRWIRELLLRSATIAHTSVVLRTGGRKHPVVHTNLCGRLGGIGHLGELHPKNPSSARRSARPTTATMAKSKRSGRQPAPSVWCSVTETETAAGGSPGRARILPRGSVRPHNTCFFDRVYEQPFQFRFEKLRAVEDQARCSRLPCGRGWCRSVFEVSPALWVRDLRAPDAPLAELRGSVLACVRFMLGAQTEPRGLMHPHRRLSADLFGAAVVAR